MNKLMIALLALSITQSGLAQEDYKQSDRVATENSSTRDNDSGTRLTEEDKAQAKKWMLKETDWAKYKQIMRGPRGIWSPNLDPITALGVSEIDPQERKRYAEIWMKMETRRIELELAFEVERMKAGKRLQGDQLAVNNTGWVEDWKKKRTEVRKQVVLFTESSCKEECEEMFAELFASIGENVRLDIYFTGGASSAQIGEWAAYMKIHPDVVKERKVTLNFEEGEAARLNVTIGKLPAVRVIDLKTNKVTDTWK